MKITTSIDTTLTPASEVKRVRATVAKFTRMTNPKDLVTWFDMEFGHEYRANYHYFAADEILKATVEGFTTYGTYGTSVRIEIILFNGHTQFTTLYFYANLDDEGFVEETARDRRLHGLTVYKAEE